MKSKTLLVLFHQVNSCVNQSRGLKGIKGLQITSYVGTDGELHPALCFYRVMPLEYSMNFSVNMELISHRDADSVCLPFEAAAPTPISIIEP